MKSNEHFIIHTYFQQDFFLTMKAVSKLLVMCLSIIQLHCGQVHYSYPWSVSPALSRAGIRQFSRVSDGVCANDSLSD